MAGSGGEDERSSWVPVRVFSLADFLLDLDTVLQQRRCHYQWERDWEKEEAVAVPTAELTAARRQDLARRLANVLSVSWYSFACTLCRIEEGLDPAVDSNQWPRPGSAY